jgi:hypothetical protein
MAPATSRQFSDETAAAGPLVDRRASPSCAIARHIFDGKGLRLSAERNPEILDAHSCPFPRVGFAGGARDENPAPPVQQTQ